MLKSCKDCEKYKSCKSPCENLVKSLSQFNELNGDKNIETPMSQLKGWDEEEKKYAPTIDNARKIDLGAIYAADTDLKTKWDNNDIIESDLTSKDYKIFNDYLAITRHDKKVRRRFYAFLGCDKITEIAKRAGSTKQNIHKQFSRIINTMAESMSCKELQAELYTPSRLKKKYRDLKLTEKY